MLLPLSLSTSFYAVILCITTNILFAYSHNFDKVFAFRYFSLKNLFKPRLVNHLNMSLVVEAALGIVIITSGIAFFKIEGTWRKASKQLDEIAKRLDFEKESFVELKRDLNEVLREFAKKADVKQADAIVNKATTVFTKEKMVVATQNG